MAVQTASSHHPGAIPPRVITLTISDSRTEADDTSGATLRQLLTAAGCTVIRHMILPDDRAVIRQAIIHAIGDPDCDAVISTGGTGVAPRDQTYEAVADVLEKTLDGFGEAFRRLSWDQVGPRAILSRALAGTCQNTAVIALPGSPRAVQLAVEQLIAPTLGHMVALLRG